MGNSPQSWRLEAHLEMALGQQLQRPTYLLSNSAVHSARRGSSLYSDCSSHSFFYV